MQTFQDDEAGYDSSTQTWTIRRERAARIESRGPVLHRATYDTITPTPTSLGLAEYIKVCSIDRLDLESWARVQNCRLIVCDRCDP